MFKEKGESQMLSDGFRGRDTPAWSENTFTISWLLGRAIDYLHHENSILFNRCLGGILFGGTGFMLKY